jgi:pimeloyl-ACP methyl ester carboxylesterase
MNTTHRRSPITPLLVAALTLGAMAALSPSTATAAKKSTALRKARTTPVTTIVATTAPPTTSPPAKTGPLAVSEACPPQATPSEKCFHVAVPLDYSRPNGPTMNLGVTVVKATDSKGDAIVSPVLALLGEFPQLSFAFPPPDQFAGHDVVYVDRRGTTDRSGTPYPPCPGMSVFTPELNIRRIGVTLAALFASCVSSAANAPTPLAMIMDRDLAAADLASVRKAFAIDKWAIHAAGSGVDIALRLVHREPGTVTAILAGSPIVQGKGITAVTALGAFDRFAADCAKVPACAAKGDMKVLLSKTMERAKAVIITRVPAGAGGGGVNIDARAMIAGVNNALRNPAVLPRLSDLLLGEATGFGDEIIGGLYAQNPQTQYAPSLVSGCQSTSGEGFPRADVGRLIENNPWGYLNDDEVCTAIGAIPVINPPPAVSAAIPVLAAQGDYQPAQSVEKTKAIFAGFPNTQIVSIPGNSYPPDCFNRSVGQAFFDAPTKPVDISCLTNPATRIPLTIS